MKFKEPKNGSKNRRKSAANTLESVEKKRWYEPEGEKTMKDERLESALEGVELTEREERYLEWLSRMDGETIEVFAGLFEKIKNAPRG